jgi:hypothetical protein
MLYFTFSSKKLKKKNLRVLFSMGLKFSLFGFLPFSSMGITLASSQCFMFNFSQICHLKFNDWVSSKLRNNFFPPFVGSKCLYFCRSMSQLHSLSYSGVPDLYSRLLLLICWMMILVQSLSSLFVYSTTIWIPP